MATASTADSPPGEAAAGASEPPPEDSEDAYEGRFGWLRRVDDAVFAVEQAIVATFLSAITVMVFLDFVDRRLTAPDSRVGLLFARLFGVEDEATSEMLQHTVAPIVTGIFLLVVLFFGVASARSPRGEKILIDTRSFIYTALAAAAFTGLGFLMSWQEMAVDEFGLERRMRVFPSKYFYLLLYALIAAPWIAQLARKKPRRWVGKALGIVVAGVVLAFFALNYFPDEYSWSKEVSLIMLLWVGFLGASICAHEGKHIRMEALSRVVPEKLEKHVNALGFLVTAGFCAIMAFLGWRYAGTMMEYGGVFEQTGIPDWIATIAIPVAFALTLLRFVAAAISTWMGGTYGHPVDDELAAAKAARSAPAGDRALDHDDEHETGYTDAAPDADSDSDADSDDDEGGRR